MRKCAFILLICILAVSLSGCSSLDQIESKAYIIVFGIDLTDDGQLELTALIPTFTEGGNSEGGSGESGGKSPLIYSVKGENYGVAIEMLQWAVPRQLNLTQLKILVISEKLSSSDKFYSIANSLAVTYRLYSATRFVVCENDAKTFINNITASVNPILATDMTELLEEYVVNGYVPDTTFADLYYHMLSIYSDPVAILTRATKSAENEQAEPASAVVPRSLDDLSVESPQANDYLGTALFRDGRMIGKLNGSQTQFCSLLRGDSETFCYSMVNSVLRMTPIGAPSIYVNTKSDPLQIDVNLYASAMIESSIADVRDIQSEIEEGLLKTIQTCQEIGVEPFGFSEKAAFKFLTYEDWLEFNWRERFKTAEISVNLNIIRNDT